MTSDGHKDGVRRWPYPQSELTQNKENVQDAINKYLGGNNMANINVWWDAKPKN
ncbi:Susd and RagB outer membrane lipoprotein [Chlamydia trachomatis]|nr:Susd and RagB outer membrane lipoprotein [Chlamydia trachomatis]